MIIKVIKKPDDPVCTRVSLGGEPDVGYYVVFRGDRDAVITCLEIALKALKDDSTIVLKEGD